MSIAFLQSTPGQMIKSILSENYMAIGGGVTFSGHYFTKKKGQLKFVLPLEEEPYFDSFGQNLFFSFNDEKFYYSFSMERSFGKRDLSGAIEGNTTLHIRYSVFDASINFPGKRPVNTRISGSFGAGITAMSGKIRNSWENALQLRSGYEIAVFDYGFNANMQANYHFNKLALYLKWTAFYYLKSPILGLSANIGTLVYF